MKFASAHDLRCSFAARLSLKLPAQQLMTMMRHESIDTTLKYYFGQNALSLSDLVYSAYVMDDPGNPDKNAGKKASQQIDVSR
ncbi:hypothetical protein Pla110_24900 [Polystyrenella longa]|uniref:Phage integrase family protein n=1 Tax=Polystyrenella longa TaxID=2528007 RepID=A0A518CNF9_9PLAN|nr:site-specific integrase [Polystyrenella longa]QDU80757.1 hypothetical protein Pla110_24900 [Polystyrenella longa]